ncbi:MAG: hypothetical protein KC503_44465 [Myxococcales bacterium]|nr:hypothetical protein [Myxococcales bacterium]
MRLLRVIAPLVGITALFACRQIAPFVASDASPIPDGPTDISTPPPPDITVDRPPTDTTVDSTRDLPIPDLPPGDIPGTPTDFTVDVFLSDGPPPPQTDASVICAPGAGVLTLSSGPLLGVAADHSRRKIYAVGSDSGSKNAVLYRIDACQATFAPDWGPAAIGLSAISQTAAHGVVLFGSPPNLAVVGSGISGGMSTGFAAIPSSLPTNAAPASNAWSNTTIGSNLQQAPVIVGSPQGFIVAMGNGPVILSLAFRGTGGVLGTPIAVLNLAQGLVSPFATLAFELDGLQRSRLTYVDSAGTIALQNLPSTCPPNCTAGPVVSTSFGSYSARAAASSGDLVMAFGETAAGLTVVHMDGTGSRTSTTINALSGFEPLGARFVGPTEVAVVGQDGGKRPYIAIIDTALNNPRSMWIASTNGQLHDVVRVGSTLFLVGELNGTAIVARCPLSTSGQCYP